MGVIDMQELAQMAEPWKEKLVTWVQELDPLYVKLILAVAVYIIVSAILKSMGEKLLSPCHHWDGWYLQV